MKKQKLTRLLALLMAGAMMTGLVACGEKDDDKDTSGDASNDNTSSQEEKEDINKDGDIELNEPGKFPIVKEGQDPVHLSIFTAPASTTQTDFSRDVNYVTKYVEDKMNIRIDWEMVSKGDKTSKQNLLFTTDNYPDIVFGTMWDSATLYSYGQAGYIIPLNKYIDGGEAHFLDAYIEEGLKVADKSITEQTLATRYTPDGKIYSLHSFGTSYHTKWANRMWVYEPWLEAVGMEMPTTTDEFYDVLKAFKEKDPNGNGKSDEIPLTGSLKSYNGDPTDFLMNSFVYYGGASQNYSSLDKDGKVVFTPEEDGFRAGLEYMNMLTNEGLLLKDTWTIDANGLKALTTQETQLVGFAPGGSIGAISTLKNRKEGDWTNWKVVAPLEGPDSVQFAKFAPAYPGAKFQITDNCETPRIAFRFGDALHDIETALTVLNGEEDVYWKFAEDGDVGLDGNPAKYTVISDSSLGSDNNVNYCWSQIAHTPQFPGYHTGMTVPGDPALDNEAILYNAGTVYAKYSPSDDTILPPLVFEGDDAKDVVDMRTSLTDYLTTQISKFITEGVTDASWEAHLKELKNRKVDELKDLYQESYDAFVERS